MARGEIGMWVPTSATLQQLEHVRSLEQVRERLTPGLLGAPEVEAISPDVSRIVMPAGGGVAGQPVCAYLVGRRQHVLVDPGDPLGPALDVARNLAASRGGSIVAIALTQVDPDHVGGAEGLAQVLQVPIFTGPGGGRPLPFDVHELADDEVLGLGDVALRAISAPGPSPAHVAFLVGERADHRHLRRSRWPSGRPGHPRTVGRRRRGGISGSYRAAGSERQLAPRPPCRWVERRPRR